MSRLWTMVLPVLLCTGCMTSALWERSSGRPRERLLGELEIPVRGPVEVPFAKQPSVGYLLEKPDAAMPPRLDEDIGKGYLCLRLEQPLSAVCFDLDLLAGRAPWRPGSVTLHLERRIRSNHRLETEPMVVEVSGSQGRPEIERWLELEVVPRFISEDEPSAELAAALDVLVDGATGGDDGAIWYAVVDAGGREVGDWRSAVERARAERSLARVEGLWVVGKRGGPPYCLVRVPLSVVLLATRVHIARDPGGDGFHWVWRTQWWGRLMPPSLAEPIRAVAAGYPVTLNYREVRRIHPYGAGGLAWRIALTPIAVAADAAVIAGFAYLKAQEAELESE